jgi:hypothetical protein
MTRIASVILLLLAGIEPSVVRAQNESPPATGSTVYLLRLERARYLQSVCVLLNGAGGYHLERHTPQKVRVFEATLDASEFRNIKHILSGDLLYNLQQNEIPDLMLKSDDDRVVLDIHRPSSWQQLSFPDSASREPFRDALDPLLKWFEALNKTKMRELSEDAGRNNCLPPSKPEFAQRKEAQPPQPSTSAPPPASVAPPPTNYLLQMFDTRLASYKLQATCLLVSSTGAYHLVKQSQSTISNALENMVLDGTLAPAEQASLRSILDAPDLVNQPDEPQEFEPVYMGGSYLTRLAILRGAKVQKIAAWRSYRIVNKVMTRSVEEHGTKLLAPLREWLKRNLDERRAVPTANPANPRCSLEK